ncbi:MAG TPA: GNAT family N-acetyltransferase [Candidatus Kryptonia bacterium]|nr:GNAT family N-acetyltransferase [Candidatus Kryptonia bacterium]
MTASAHCKVEVVDPRVDARWMAVESLPQATLYHSAAWARLIAGTYGFRPRYYLAADGSQIVGGLPCFEVGGAWRGRRLVSLPFSDFGGPAGDASARARLTAALLTDASAEHWRTVELRGAAIDADAQSLTESVHADNYTLSLDRSLCDLARGFADSVKWGRKRALREGVEVERSSTFEALREFYRLHQLTRRKLGVPVQSWKFFERLAGEFFTGDAGFVMHARHAGAVVASAVFLRHGARLYYKFSASDPLKLALQPNSLLLWQAIEWAKREGLAELDLGKTVRENIGLARFKRSWGAQATPLPHYYFPRVAGLAAQSEDDTRLRALRAVWRRLPLPVTRVIGGLVYRALA